MALKLGVSATLTSCGSWFQVLSAGINQDFLQVISNLWLKGFIGCLSAVLQGAAVPYSPSPAAGDVTVPSYPSSSSLLSLTSVRTTTCSAHPCHPPPHHSAILATPLQVVLGDMFGRRTMAF